MEYKEYKMANRAVFLYRLRIAAVAVIAAFACGVIMAFSFLISAAVAALSFPALIIIFLSSHLCSRAKFAKQISVHCYF